MIKFGSLHDEERRDRKTISTSTSQVDAASSLLLLYFTPSCRLLELHEELRLARSGQPKRLCYAEREGRIVSKIMHPAAEG